MQTDILRRRPVVIVFSVLAGLQVLSAGLALTDVLSADVVSLIVLVIAAVQAGATFYVQGMVTPWETVVSQVTLDGDVVDGPAVLPKTVIPPKPNLE